MEHVCCLQVQCHDPPWRACSGLHVIQSPLDLCTRLVDAGWTQFPICRERMFHSPWLAVDIALTWVFKQSLACSMCVQSACRLDSGWSMSQPCWNTCRAGSGQLGSSGHSCMLWAPGLQRCGVPGHALQCLRSWRILPLLACTGTTHPKLFSPHRDCGPNTMHDAFPCP